MLKVRVIPTLLWKNVGLVKGVRFDSWRRVGTVMPAVKVYNTRDVDELVLLDITATREERSPDYDSIRDIASECFMPLTVGGGVRSLEEIRELLRAGADKVSINTAAYVNPQIIQEASSRFGSQCVVISIDVKKEEDGRHQCYSRSGTFPTGLSPEQWCKQVERLGAGEILLTSIDRDGTMEGYDLALLEKVSRSVSIPVIASGGAGEFSHMVEALQIGRATAVAAASIFHFTEKTPLEAKQFLAQQGMPVRNVAQVVGGLRSPMMTYSS